METTRESLLLRVRDLRDQKSWDEFVELYGPLILRYLRRIGVSEQDVLELVQDVLLIVVRHIGNFEYDPAKSFRAWLRKITTNRAFRFFTEKRRWPITPGGTTHVEVIHQVAARDNSLDEMIEAEWRKRRLEVAIKRVREDVSPPLWRTFELRYIEGLPSAEVANQMGITVGNVFTRVCRVLRSLRAALEEIDE